MSGVRVSSDLDKVVALFLIGFISVTSSFTMTNGFDPSSVIRPKANDLTVTTSMNTPVTVTFSGSGSEDLRAALVSNPSNGQVGTIDQEKGTVEYTPFDGFVEQIHSAT